MFKRTTNAEKCVPIAWDTDPLLKIEEDKVATFFCFDQKDVHWHQIQQSVQ